MSTLRSRITEAIAGTVHVASEAAATVDAVMDAVTPVPQDAVRADKPERAIDDAHQGAVTALIDLTLTATRLRARLDRNRRALARVKGERDEARARLRGTSRSESWAYEQLDNARAELAALRAAPDPAAGLTVTPDGQRVVDGDGRCAVTVVGRWNREPAKLRREAAWHETCAARSTRTAAALRLLADHPEAAEATPTVDEDASDKDVERVAEHMLAGGGPLSTVVPEAAADLRRQARSLLASGVVILAARAARTWDGA